MPLNKDCSEIVQLLTLDEDELNVKFESSVDLCNMYNICMDQEIMITTRHEEPNIMGYEEPDTNSESEEEIIHNLKPNSVNMEEGEFSRNQEETKAKIKKNDEFNNFSKVQASTGTTSINNSSIPGIGKSSNPSNYMLYIDCVNNLEERKGLIDKWATQISLVIQSNINDYASGKTVLLLDEHRTEGIVKNLTKRIV